MLRRLRFRTAQIFHFNEVNMGCERVMKVLAAAAMVAVVAGAAVAQGPGRTGERGWGMGNDDGSGYGMMGWGSRWGMWRGRGPDWMVDRVEGRLAFIKAELKITEAQKSAWDELASVIRSAATHHNERMRAVFSGAEDAKTLPQRIEAQEQFMTTRLEEIRQVKGSLNKLYALLSDEQKKEADHVVLPMVGMGGPWGRAN
jgi:hypothetical protein